MGASGLARADVPDPTLRAVVERTVRLELAEGAVDGRVLGFDRVSVTIARTTGGEVVTVPRDRVMRVIDVAPPQRVRMLGVQMSLLGTLAVDVEHGWFRAFASTSLLLPILTASGEGVWTASAIGGGIALPLAGRWKLDVFAEVLPLHVTSWYTYLGFGLGAGAHYTAPSGFALGISFPVVGFATRIGSSPYGYDPSFRYNDSLGYFYFAGAAGMPLLTFGYRFAAPRSIANISSRSRLNAASSK